MQNGVRESGPWFFDSACSTHMTGSFESFISLQQQEGSNITFGNNSKGQVMGIGKVRISNNFCVNNVSFVKGLGYNLLSVSQLCANNLYQVVFDSHGCQVIEISSGKILLRGTSEINLYKVVPWLLPKEKLCLQVIKDVANLWHNRFGHASLQLIDKLHKQDLVRGLPKIDPNKYEICEACVKGKQVRSSCKSKKEVSSTKPLELIHMDLCGSMWTYASEKSRR